MADISQIKLPSLINAVGDTLTKKTWNDGYSNINGHYVWTDGDNIYYSSSSTQYVLDKATSTWSAKTWTGLSSFDGYNIWTDGDNIYYSSSSTQYVLDKATSTWSAKTWSGLSNFSGENVWTDGDNIYYSSWNNHYVLDKATSTWSAKTWTVSSGFDGRNVWTDFVNVYSSAGSKQYVLDKATSTWSVKTWSGASGMYGNSVWTDGEKYYVIASSSKDYEFSVVSVEGYKVFNIKDVTARQYSYKLPIASASTLGGIKVGSGLSIDANGVLSVDGGGGSSYDLADDLQLKKGLTAVVSSGMNANTLYINGGTYDGYSYTGSEFSLSNAKVGEVYTITGLVDGNYAQYVSGGVSFNGTNTSQHYMKTNTSLFTESDYYKLPFKAQVVTKVFYESDGSIDYTAKRLMPLCEPAQMPSASQPPDVYSEYMLQWFDVPERKANSYGVRVVRRCCYSPSPQTMSSGATKVFDVPLTNWGPSSTDESADDLDFIGVGGSCYMITTDGTSPYTSYHVDIVKMVWDGISPANNGKISVTVKNNTGETISSNNGKVYLEIFVEGKAW